MMRGRLGSTSEAAAVRLRRRWPGLRRDRSGRDSRAFALSIGGDDAVIKAYGFVICWSSYSPLRW